MLWDCKVITNIPVPTHTDNFKMSIMKHYKRHVYTFSSLNLFYLDPFLCYHLSYGHIEVDHVSTSHINYNLYNYVSYVYGVKYTI